MDPNITYTLFVTAIRARDIKLAREYAEYLADWLRKGGFKPTALLRPRAMRAFETFLARNMEAVL